MPVAGCAAVVRALAECVLALRRWQRAGIWRRIFTALQGRADAAGLITWDVSVDATVNRARQHAAGARRDRYAQAEPPSGVEYESADHGLGRSRGGFSTKLHLAVEQGPKMLSLVVTAGQRGDSQQFKAALNAQDTADGSGTLTSVSSLAATQPRRRSADR